MSHPVSSRRELILPYKAKGPSRPFMDENLQIQIPDLEEVNEVKSTTHYSDIYSHYSNQLKSFSSESDTNLKEKELESLIAQTQQSYEAWKRLRDIIVEKMATFSSKK